MGMGDVSATYKGMFDASVSNRVRGQHDLGGGTYVAVKLEYPLFGHLWRPDTGGKDKGVACAGFFCIDTKLPCLLRGLPACPSNY